MNAEWSRLDKLSPQEKRLMQIQSLPPSIQRRSERMQMPRVYEEAINAVRACTTIDMTKYYSEKADALAAFAKMYGDEQLSKEAARIKLHAYAQMGRLAEALRPTGRGRAPKGARSLLIEHGLTCKQADAASGLGRLSDNQLEPLFAEPKSPYTTYAQSVAVSRTSAAWKKLQRAYNGGTSFLSFVRGNPAQELARGLQADEVKRGRAQTVELIEWLDAFERALPK